MGMLMSDKKTATISARTRLFKASGAIFILAMGLGVPLVASVFIMLSRHAGYGNHAAYVAALCMAAIILVYWVLEIITFVPIDIGVFENEIELRVAGATVAVRFQDIIKISQREGLIRDDITVHCQSRAYRLNNVPHGYRIVEAIMDNAISSSDERSRTARFVVQRELGGMSLSEGINMRARLGPPILDMSNGFLRHALSGQLKVLLPAVLVTFGLTWLAFHYQRFPAQGSLADVAIILILLVTVFLAPTYALFTQEHLYVFPEQVVVETATSQRSISRGDIGSCTLHRHFLVPFIRLRLTDGTTFELRGYANPASVKATIDFSKVIASRQEIAESLREAQNTAPGFSISLEKAGE